MITQIAIGFSSADDPSTAFRDAAVMAKSQTGATRHALAMASFTPAYAPNGEPNAPDPLENLRKTLNPEKLIGLCAPSLIWTNGIENKGVMVLAISSDELSFGLAAKSSVSFMPLQMTGLKFARELAASMPSGERQGAVVFCDALTLNHSLLIRGLQEGLGRVFSIAGAINPGGLLYQNQFLTDSISGVVFGGKTSFVSAIRHGWQPLGKPRIIDNSEGNLIRTIDGKPAVSIYQEYFPEEFAALPNRQLGDIGLLYPLGLSTNRPKEYIIKNPSGILPDGSLICQGEIPRGTQVHLMIGDKDACRQAAHDAAVEVHDKLHGRHPKLIFIFASLSRRKLFGRSAGQEINQIKELLGLACPVFGMYTNGELGAASEMDLQTHNAGIMIASLG
ncbi:MAG: FIST C-terminal domain-containing protein [Candidatus Omnitrophica bacterium]|nr:FIST C-terminal domain-containing protein [Candidatus Omnitrophota bacterium]